MQEKLSWHPTSSQSASSCSPTKAEQGVGIRWHEGDELLLLHATSEIAAQCAMKDVNAITRLNIGLLKGPSQP